MRRLLVLLALAAAAVLLAGFNVDRVAAERDPCAAFKNNPPASYTHPNAKACLDIVEVGATGLAPTEPAGDVQPAAIVPPPGGGSCKWAQVERWAKNVLGQKLWSYFQKIEWCYNGTYITAKTRLRWAEVYFPGWEFKGHIGNYESGGVGYWSYRAWTQGKFSFCPLNLGCIQHVYPWIDMTVYANGNWTYSWG